MDEVRQEEATELTAVGAMAAGSPMYRPEAAAAA